MCDTIASFQFFLQNFNLFTFFMLPPISSYCNMLSSLWHSMNSWAKNNNFNTGSLETTMPIIFGSTRSIPDLSSTPMEQHIFEFLYIIECATEMVDNFMHQFHNIKYDKYLLCIFFFPRTNRYFYITNIKCLTQWGSITHQMVIPISSKSSCVS